VIRPAPDWFLPRVIAHRCGGALAPENTLAGLRVASGMRMVAVEFDVMLSADGTPWLIHDETLERTTNGRGRVCETPDAVLATIDAGFYRHASFAGEPLPTLADAAALCRELGLMANVEIKPAEGFEAVTGEVVAKAIIEHWRGAPLPLVSSFSGVALERAREAAPQLPLACLWERPPQDWLLRLEALGAFSLHCAAKGIDDAILQSAAANGVPVLCYTVDDRDEAATLLERGVSAVISDRIDLVSSEF
jgi:glycerophosphoryl diester phosphodiesterase